MADYPGKKVFLTETQLDSVKVLSEIRKCVYLMESLTSPGIFRFGGIGVRKNQENTALRRLGQCTHTSKDKIISSWKYIAMLKFEESADTDVIVSHEKKLRNYLFVDKGLYAGLRTGKKRKADGLSIPDSGRKFLNAREKLIDAFTVALKQKP